MTDVTRTLMLRAGRASLGIWLREGIVADPLLRQHSHASYDRLAGQVPWPVHPVLRLHLVFSVLPGAAFYTAMREQGWTEDAAADAVARTLTAMARPHRRLIQRLTRHESGRRLFMRVAAGGTPLAFPAPGWQTTWIDRSPTRVAFDMTRCFILDLLRRLEATAIAPAYCAVDNTLYDNLCPELCWARTGTLANGASHCDFRFEHRTPTVGEPTRIRSRSDRRATATKWRRADVVGHEPQPRQAAQLNRGTQPSHRPANLVVAATRSAVNARAQPSCSVGRMSTSLTATRRGRVTM